MNAESAVPDIQAALFDLLTDDDERFEVTEDDRVRVFWGPEPDEHEERALISVGYEEESDGDHELLPRTVPTGAQEERCRNQILIEALAESGVDHKPAYDRAWAIANAVEAAINETPNLGLEQVLVRGDGRISRHKHNYFRLADQRGSRVTLTFAATARI